MLKHDRKPRALFAPPDLSAIQGHRPVATHHVADPRMQVTLPLLDALFDAACPINHGRARRTARRQ